MMRNRGTETTTWVVLVGIDKYQHLPKLRNSVADVNLIRTLLIEEFGVRPEHILTILDQDATFSRLRDEVPEIIRNWDTRDSDQLLFFFAGHADIGLLSRKRAWYIVPVDGRISKRSPKWATVITGKELRLLEEAFRGAHILYALDACYAGMQVKADAPDRGRVTSAYAMVAGRGGDPVLDDGGNGHSLFSESFADALRGWAPIDTDENGSFRASDLNAFVRSDVPRRLRRQHRRRIQRPFGVQLKISEQGDEFAFRPVSSRLPADTIRALFSGLVQVRKAAVSGLGQLAPEYAEPALTALGRLSKDDSAAVRAEVASQLGAIENEEGYRLLVSLLKDQDDLVRITAAHSIALVGQHFSTDAIRALKAANSSNNGRVRRSFNYALAKLGDVPSVRAVVRDLPLQEGSIRREMIGVLRDLAGSSISERQLTEVLQSSLRSNDWRTRRAAAEATGELGLKNAGGTLARLATDPKQHYMVRYAATEALGHIGTASAASAVRQVLVHDASLFARTAAAEATGTLEAPGRAADLRHALERDEEWRVRRAAAEACGFIQDPETIPSLIYAATDPHFRVRLAVAWALGEIGGDDAKRMLDTMVKDRSSLVRRSADRSLTQLSS